MKRRDPKGTGQVVRGGKEARTKELDGDGARSGKCGAEAFP